LPHPHPAMSFNRLLLVIKQTAFDAYTCREAAAAAAAAAGGVSRSHEGVRMARLRERHDTHNRQAGAYTRRLLSST